MEGKLIASVLVPAQTPPQRKKLSEQEQATASGILLGFFFFFAVAVAISMRRSAHTAKNQYSTFSAQVEQNKQDAENWKQANLEKIKIHRLALYEEFNRTVTQDQYGNQDSGAWLQASDFVGVDIGDIKENILNNSGFRAGWTYFWRNVLVDRDDINADEWFTGWFKYEKYAPVPDDSQWYNVVLDWIQDEIISVAKEVDEANAQREEAGYSEDMSGEDYEIYCGRILQEAGWNVEQTQASNDQGVDLIAQIEDLKVCIQCKRYSNPVGNKAVQEVIAGKAFYNGTHAVVVSNAGFTKAAKSLAESADVILISDTELEDLETMV